MSRFIFPRGALAKAYVDALLGRTPFAYASGLILAAPRRTGKSTFLRRDLVPALEAEGVVCVYVDLWANRAADPADLIADALADALRNAAGPIARAARGSGLAKVTFGGVSIDLDRIGKPDGGTLSDALKALAARTGGTVALVVDEAQHALSSEAGMAAMFALKAARDALNQERAGEDESRPRLVLVFTGSHRDKLAALVLRRDQPFYGASVVDFPLLGRDYVAAYVDWLNERLAPDNRFDVDDVARAFDILGRRPELLESVLRDYALGETRAAGLRRTLARSAESLRERVWDQYDSDYGSLTPLQRAVLALVIREGDRLAPFAEATSAELARVVGSDVTPRDVQGAMEVLRERGLVWRSGRGAYAIEDQGMAEWLAARQPPPES